jgi:hypothetical protein
MSITIPVEIPDGSIAIGFYYDEATGKLEGIPFKSMTSNSITLVTRHFLSGNMMRSDDSSLKSSSPAANTGARIIVSSISESLLNSKPVISSGFKPGTDDWEFVNIGSYIAIGGHCFGQSMTAMWYYFEKKESEGSLFNRYSVVPSIWQDNAIGYRWCSVMHQDISATGKIATWFWENVDRNQDLDELKLQTIAGAILITGEPQGINIYRQTGVNADGFPLYDSHAVVCYQVGITDQLLYISEPNTPANPQTISLVNGRFEAYAARTNGNAEPNPYPYITWYAKTAFIDWIKIGKRYNELTDSTIGNRAPNTFPAYTIWVKGKTDVKITNGFTSDSDTLRCYVECPHADLAYPENGKRLTRFGMYDANGTKIDVAEINRKYYVILKPGLNRIGFNITARITDVKDLSGNFIENYIDFKWFDVYYSKLKISPNPIYGQPDREVTMMAMSDGTAPAKSKYVWNFGDGTKEVTVVNDSTVTHKFAKEGPLSVGVKLYDTSTGKITGTASASANISNFYLGQSYGGGIIIYIDQTGQHGLIAASSHQSASAPWGCTGTAVDGTSVALGTGQANTKAILKSCGDAGIAARLCDQYSITVDGVKYDDWFLPSKDELWHMCNNSSLLPGWYGGESWTIWSSSEGTAATAWQMFLVTGYPNWGYVSKGTPKTAVRAVRVF